MDQVYEALPASSFLEWAFLRWILAAAASPDITKYVVAQRRADLDRSGDHRDRQQPGQELDRL